MVMSLLAGCGSEGQNTSDGSATPSASSGSGVQTDDVTYDANATIVYAISAGWETLVPFHWSTASYNGTLVWDKIYDKLVTVHSDTTYTARAAQSWEQSADKKVMTFHLDPRCKWHDGEAVTAEDWVWTAQLLASADFVTTDGPKLCALFAGTDDNGAMISEDVFGVKALDNYTLEISFKNPISYDTFFNTYSCYYHVIPKHCFEGVAAADIQEDDFWMNPIGSGPMKFDSMLAGSEITFVPNEDYQLGGPQFGKLVMRVISTSNYASSFMTGEIDFCYPFVSIDEANDLRGESNVVVTRAELATSLTFLFVNHEMISDVRVRQAMDLLIDKQMIVDSLYGGEAIPTESCVIPGTAVYNDSLVPTRDVEKAKALLDEAGWDYNTVIKVAASSSIRERIALIIQQNWGEVGLQMDLETVDAGTLFGGLYSGTYSMGVGGGLASADPFYQNTNFDYRANTIYRIKDTAYIDFANAAAEAATDEEYVQIVKDYQQYMFDNMTMIPLIFAYDYGVTSSRLTGITPNDCYRSNDLVWEWRVLA